MITIERILENQTEISAGFENIIFKAKNQDEIIGKISMRLKDSEAVVYELDGESFILDGLVRAVLNCAAKVGARKAFFECGYENELKKLGYTDGLDINKFFNNKNCKNSL